MNNEWPDQSMDTEMDTDGRSHMIWDWIYAEEAWRVKGQLPTSEQFLSHTLSFNTNYLSVILWTWLINDNSQIKKSGTQRNFELVKTRIFSGHTILCSSGKRVPPDGTRWPSNSVSLSSLLTYWFPFLPCQFVGTHSGYFV